MAKESLTSSSLLVHYDSTLPLRLATDASAYGIIAHHAGWFGTPYLVRVMHADPADRNYAQLEKEALALVFGINIFHQYLFGRKFTLVFDHRLLLAVLGPKKMIPPQADT